MKRLSESQIESKIADIRNAANRPVRNLIEGYVDVKDGDYGQPVANKAMRAVQAIDAAIAKAEGR